MAALTQSEESFIEETCPGSTQEYRDGLADGLGRQADAGLQQDKQTKQAKGEALAKLPT